MDRTRVNEEEAARLRLALAAAGVALYEDAPGPRAPLDDANYADLLRSLLGSGEARLLVAIPCLLAANDGPAAARAVREVATGLVGEERAQLGLLYRLARALVVSRAPDLRRLLGRIPTLDAIPSEPAELPDPASRHGEDCVREAVDHADFGPIAGGAERAFDTWVGILTVEASPREPA